jgi:hypothetical protein
MISTSLYMHNSDVDYSYNFDSRRLATLDHFMMSIILCSVIRYRAQC